MRKVVDEKGRRGTKRKASDALHECGILGCTYKTKQASTLRVHQANIHGVNVIYHECKEEGCEYKAKKAGTLKQHLADMHDIGVVLSPLWRPEDLLAWDEDKARDAPFFGIAVVALVVRTRVKEKKLLRTPRR